MLAFASVKPAQIILKGYPDSDISGRVKIIEGKYPFKITQTRAKKGKNIRFRLAEIDDSKQRGYILTVENQKKEAGRYYDDIILTTDSQIKPVIAIRVYGIIMKKEKHEQ